MASGDLLNIFTGTQSGLMHLQFSYEYRDPLPTEINFKFSVEIQQAQITAEISARANLSNSTLSLTPMNITLGNPLTVCLLGCAGAAVLQPLIDCFDADIKKYLSCLSGKGLSIGTSVAACAITCFTSTSPAPTP
jgi:hypothetical protein